MSWKKLAVTLGAAAIVSGGAFFAFHVHQPKTTQSESGRPAGVINPEHAAAGMKTEAQPQLSTDRFEPPPTITTGTYTDPNYRKEAARNESPPKNDSKR